MTRRLLVLRPEPGASATCAAAAQAGWCAVRAPLFVVRPCAWALPVALPPALLLTSANAARLGGAALAELVHLPVYAVGEATAAAAREAGFALVTAGEGDGASIVARAAADGVAALLHLTGREHRALPAAIPIERRIVYAADPVPRLPEAACEALPAAVALLHSPRAAALFATLAEAAGYRRDALSIAAISPAAAAAAGEGWQAAAIAERPADTALLAAAAKLCNQEPRRH